MGLGISLVYRDLREVWFIGTWERYGLLEFARGMVYEVVWFHSSKTQPRFYLLRLLAYRVL